MFTHPRVCAMAAPSILIPEFDVLRCIQLHLCPQQHLQDRQDSQSLLLTLFIL